MTGPSSHSPSQKRRSRSAGLLRVIAGDLLIVLIACGLLELAVRIVAPQNTTRLMRDAYEVADGWRFGYRYRSGLTRVCNNGYGDHRFATNRWGMRDREYGPKAPGEWRILIVGNSFNENQALEAEQLYAKRLEAALAEAYPDRKISVLNAGMAGWGLWHYHDFLETTLKEIEPDVVVLATVTGVSFLRSDRAPASRRMAIRAGLPVRRNASLAQRAEWALWYGNEVLEEHSHAWNVFRRAAYYPMRWLGLGRYTTLGPLCTEPELPAEVLEPTTSVVGKLRDVCKRHGARTALLFVPLIYEVRSSATWEHTQLDKPDVTSLDVTRPSRLTREIARRLDLPLCDPSESLRKHEAPTYFRIFAHWNEAGNRVVARELEEFLEAEELLGPPAPHPSAGKPEPS